MRAQILSARRAPVRKVETEVILLVAAGHFCDRTYQLRPWGVLVNNVLSSACCGVP